MTVRICSVYEVHVHIDSTARKVVTVNGIIIIHLVPGPYLFKEESKTDYLKRPLISAIKHFNSAKRPASIVLLQGVHYFCVPSLPNTFFKVCFVKKSINDYFSNLRDNSASIRLFRSAFTFCNLGLLINFHLLLKSISSSINSGHLLIGCTYFGCLVVSTA